MGTTLKRFTGTGKWADNWFRPLSPTAKLLWVYLLDHCDNAGVVAPDVELASFQIGAKVDDAHFTELGDRIKKLSNGKLWIPKFIRFQFGELSQTSKVHASVIRLLQVHGIEYSIPLESDSNESLMGGQSTKAKEKEKEKEIEKWLEGLQASPVYSWISIKTEFEKARQWILANKGRHFNRRFFINWLNRIEKPLSIGEYQPTKSTTELDCWPVDRRFNLTRAPERKHFQSDDSFQSHRELYEHWKKKRLAEKAKEQ
jgi:hypothetical protein